MTKNLKRVCITGSTGSIGCNTLEVIDNLHNHNICIEVLYLTTNKRIDILASQIKKYSPKSVVILNENAAENFKVQYNFKDLEILKGYQGLIEIVSRNDYDLLINGLVGFSGLKPTIIAIESGKDVALANKESLVVAGKLVNELLKKHNTKLLPIDSEHSAILQCLIGENKDSVRKLILTASGGPFRNKSLTEIKDISVEEALCHPNWKMGNKITIDSATLMNKGLEVIEAKWLFDKNENEIEVLIHPQSIVHSMVEFRDGSIKAQLGVPDMKIPIQYALTYPDRISSDYVRMDFNKMNMLTFESPDFTKFRCLKIAYDVLKAGGTYAVVLNAANEIAVDLFLKEKIKFLQIPEMIESQLSMHNNSETCSLEDIIDLDMMIRKKVLESDNSFSVAEV
ncbi:MAG: 1-deoxy-D-xylulose-5-phosphate reductoisomerase [Ignavibacteria bacterium]